MLNIRAMTEADLPLGLQLKTLAGWNQTEADWRALFQYHPAGCFVAEWQGRAVATTTTTVHEGNVGWIGMVLVHPDARGQGIGTALLEHAIADLRRRGVRSIKLDATPAGKRVYVPLGFRDEYELERVELNGSPALPLAGPSPAAQRLMPGRLEDILRLDRAAFGADRTPVIRRIVGEFPEYCWQVNGGDSAEIDGFICARAGANAWHIGPWMAQAPDIADILLRTCLAKLAGRRVFMDVSLNHPARELAATYGFKSQRPLTRMWLDGNDWPGKPQRVFAIADPAKG